MRGIELRRALAADTGKAMRALSRRLGRGGGTSFPGLLALRLDPSLVRSLAASLPQGCVLVTGTNGKTTTCRLIAEALCRAGSDPLQNREGSNLLRGVATALLAHTDLWGRLAASSQGIGIFELDEGAFPEALEPLSPRLVVITNLFRDQLDRYFEVDYVASLWQKAMARLPSSTVVALNADDPHVAHLGRELANPVLYYGLEDIRHGQPSLEHAADARRCLRCGVDYQYGVVFYAHLGHYSCPRCGWQRPRPQVSAWRVDGLEADHYLARVSSGAGDLALEVPLPGLYNVYNVLAAVAALRALGVDHTFIKAGVRAVEAAFGRWEWLEIQGRRVCLALVKNPAGFNEVLRTLSAGGTSSGLLLALNDNVPDGRDVSWIWDADLERLRGVPWVVVVVAGLRHHDLALRLKYAGLPSDNILFQRDIVQALRLALAHTPPGSSLYVVPTYTAMWELRGELARFGYLPHFWQERRAGPKGGDG